MKTVAGPLRARRLAEAIALVLLLAACSPIRSLAALSRSHDAFVPYTGDTRIQVEPGAEDLAAQVSPLITEAIRTVEATHAAPFVSHVTIHVCATNASYYRFTGQRSPATTTNKVYLSPELFQGHRPLHRYLTHELSHFHLVQRLGLLGAIRLPEWFKEGLAELVSGGATGTSVPVSDALRAISEGRSLVPDEGRGAISSFLIPHYGSYWNIENRMFYRQSMLFVQFIRDQDRDAFHRFLTEVERGNDFKGSLRSAYPGGVPLLWAKFLDHARTSANLAL